MLALWTICHEWTSGARHVFSCCPCHFATLMIRSGSNHILTRTLSKEGVTEGDPLAMVMHGARSLPLIWILKKPFPKSINPGMLMTREPVEASRKLGFASRNFKNFAPQGATSQSLRRVFSLSRSAMRRKLRSCSGTSVLKSSQEVGTLED